MEGSRSGSTTLQERKKYADILAAKNFGGAEKFLQIMSFKFHERDDPDPH
jgi:hypothetical protein